MVEDLLPFICGLLFNVSLVVTGAAMGDPNNYWERRWACRLIQLLNFAYFGLMMYTIGVHNGWFS